MSPQNLQTTIFALKRTDYTNKGNNSDMSILPPFTLAASTKSGSVFFFCFFFFCFVLFFFFCFFCFVFFPFRVAQNFEKIQNLGKKLLPLKVISLLTLVLLIPDILCLCEQCRYRSVGF